jgi:hypothetical protein
MLPKFDVDESIFECCQNFVVWIGSLRLLGLMWLDMGGGGTARFSASSWLFFESSNLKGSGSKEPIPFWFSISAASFLPVGKTGNQGVSQPALFPFSVVVGA